MRRTVVAGLAALSLVAGAVYAQTERNPQSPYTIQSNSGIKTSDGKAHLKGNVRIVLDGGTVVTADEAVYDESSREVELIGHVRLKFAPPPSHAPSQ